MANFHYLEARLEQTKGGIDYSDPSPDDFNVLLVMTNTIIDEEAQKDGLIFLGDLTSVQIDEYDGATYARQTLGSITVTKVAASDFVKWDAADAVWNTLGAGSRSAQAAVIIRDTGTDATSRVICYIDSGGFPFDGNGGKVTLKWHADGIIKFT